MHEANDVIELTRLDLALFVLIDGLELCVGDAVLFFGLSRLDKRTNESHHATFGLKAFELGELQLNQEQVSKRQRVIVRMLNLKLFTCALDPFQLLQTFIVNFSFV